MVANHDDDSCQLPIISSADLQTGVNWTEVGEAVGGRDAKSCSNKVSSTVSALAEADGSGRESRARLPRRSSASASES
jgi:hypothetical protein